MRTWIVPRTDWTAQDYINFSDFIRIHDNMENLRHSIQEFTGAVASLTPNTLTDEYALPCTSVINALERNLDALKAALRYDLPLPDTQTWPQTRNPDHTDVDRWESYLALLHRYIGNMVSAWHYSGELFAGEI